ncbi:MAG: FtsX-like permease family protein, partial [Flavobacterium sp.]
MLHLLTKIKTVYFNNNYPNTVSGVIEDVPANSHFTFSGLRSLPSDYTADWQAFELYTYLLLKKNANITSLESKLPAFYKKHLEPSMGAGIDYRMELQPLTSIHLHSSLEYEMAANGNMQYIYVFTIIGLLVLIIASINYMNLSTARSVLRAKEIGVRKTIGAGRRELILQFLSESVLISWMATILAFLCTWLALPWLNELSGLQLTIDSLLRWSIIIPLLFVPFIVGIVSGLYPALFLSSFQPVKVLKGILKIENSPLSFRKVLVVIQFAVSIILIIGTIVVAQQLRYMQNKALGFDRDHVVVMSYNNALAEKFDGFRNELLANNSIKDVGRSSRIPTGRLLDASGARIK